MTRQSSVGWACGWLVSAVFWLWIVKKLRFPGPLWKGNEKWNERAHSVGEHLQRFQSHWSYRARALSSVAKSSLSQLDVLNNSNTAAQRITLQINQIATILHCDSKTLRRQECLEITYMAMGFRPHSFPVEGMYVKGIGGLTRVKKKTTHFSWGRGDITIWTTFLRKVPCVFSQLCLPLWTTTSDFYKVFQKDDNYPKNHRKTLTPCVFIVLLTLVLKICSLLLHTQA